MGVQPAPGGGVVVGAGVHHAVVGVIVGQVAAVLVGVKGKLQHLHAGVAAVFQQALYRGGKEAQVLGDDGGVLHVLVDGPDEVHAGALAPAAVAGGGVPVGDGVVALQPPEVVDAQHIVHGEVRLDALDPPGVAVLLHHVPAVEGVAPQLAVGGEGVRRAAGDLGGHVLLIQLEQPGLGPHVGAVHGHIDGRVPNDLHAPLVGVLLQGAPLLEEQVLGKDVVVHVLLVLFPALLQGGGVPQAQPLLPLGPGAALVLVLQSHVEGVILHPLRVFLAERLQGLFVLKVFKSLAQQLFPAGAHHIIVHMRGVLPPLHPLAGALFQKTCLRKLVQVDIQGLSRKGRIALIGAVPKAGGPQGQHLPIPLFGLHQEIHPLTGGLAEIADAVFRGQAAHRQQHPSGPGHPRFLCHSDGSFLCAKGGRAAPRSHTGPSIAPLGAVFK